MIRFWNKSYKQDQLSIAARIASNYKNACEELNVQPTLEGFIQTMEDAAGNYEEAVHTKE